MDLNRRPPDYSIITLTTGHWVDLDAGIKSGMLSGLEAGMKAWMKAGNEIGWERDMKTEMVDDIKAGTNAGLFL